MLIKASSHSRSCLLFYNFTTLANTSPNEKCMMLGRAGPDGKFAVALLRKSNVDKSVQVHTKKYATQEDAMIKTEKEFIKPYCPLTDYTNLKSELQKLVDPAKVAAEKCKAIIDRSDNFFTNFYKIYRKTLPTSNSLSAAYASNCEEITKALDSTQILMHKDAYNILEYYNKSLGNDKKTPIHRLGSLIKERPIAFSDPMIRCRWQND